MNRMSNELYGTRQSHTIFLVQVVDNLRAVSVSSDPSEP